MTFAINNNTTAHKPSFAGLAIFGEGANKYLAHRAKIEGQKAVDEALKYIDSLRDWGYVNLNKTLKEDVVQLEGQQTISGKTIPITTQISLSDSLDFLIGKIKFLVEQNKTFK